MASSSSEGVVKQSVHFQPIKTELQNSFEYLENSKEPYNFHTTTAIESYLTEVSETGQPVQSSSVKKFVIFSHFVEYDIILGFVSAHLTMQFEFFSIGLFLKLDNLIVTGEFCTQEKMPKNGEKQVTYL